MSCLLAVAPNGARKTKEDHFNLPLTAKEIGVCAKECMQAGAGMIHLHVRDNNQKHSLSIEQYKEAIEQVRQQTGDGILIQVTSEAVGIYTAEQQFSMIHTLKPPAVSIGLREIKHLDEKLINQHFTKMRANNVLPQIILYNMADLALYHQWMERGVLIGSAYPLLYVIGKEQPDGAFEKSDLEVLAKESNNWMICAFGQQEFNVGKLASNLGGHVRLGFENNCLLESGDIANNNAELIRQMSTCLSNKAISVANADNARKLMQPDW